MMSCILVLCACFAAWLYAHRQNFISMGVIELKRIYKRVAACLGAVALISSMMATTFAQEVESIEERIEERILQNPDVVLASLELEKSGVELKKLKRELKELKEQDHYSKRDAQQLERQIYYAEKLPDILYEETLGQKRIELRKAFYDYLYNLEKLSLKEDSLQTSKELFAQAKIKLDEGYISPFDYEQAEISLRNKQTELERANISFEGAKHSLNTLLGREIGSEIGSLDMDFGMDEFNIDGIGWEYAFEKMQEGDYELLSAEKTAEFSKMEYDKLKAHYTDINLDAKIQKAQCERDALNLEQKEKILESEFLNEKAGIEVSVEEIGNSAVEVSHLEKKYDAVKKKYELGYASVNELEEEYQSLQDKRLEHLSKVHGYNIKLMEFKEEYKLNGWQNIAESDIY